MKKKGKQQYMYFKSWDFEDFKSFQKETTHKFNPIRKLPNCVKWLTQLSAVSAFSLLNGKPFSNSKFEH